MPRFMIERASTAVFDVRCVQEQQANGHRSACPSDAAATVQPSA